MITQVWIKNYRSIAEVSVRLGPLTVFVGRNGSGKSNFVRALQFVADALRVGLDAAILKRGGIGALRRLAPKGRPHDVEISLALQENGHHGRYQITLAAEGAGGYRVRAEQCQMVAPDGRETGFELRDGRWVTMPSGVQPAVQDRTLVLPLLAGLLPFKQVYEQLTDVGLYRIFPDDLAPPQREAEGAPLEEQGENLATVLRDLKQGRNGSVSDLELALARVLHDVQGYQITRIGGYLVTSLRHRFSQGEPTQFELAQESDGTLRVLAILAALYQKPPRRLIALEEPELYVHPGVMGLLWEELRDASQRMQIVLTTHSPDLLDLCTPDQLRVVEKIEGVTHIAGLADDQRRIVQEHLFAPGQLLQAQGLRRAVEA